MAQMAIAAIGPAFRFEEPDFEVGFPVGIPVGVLPETVGDEAGLVVELVFFEDVLLLEELVPLEELVELPDPVGVAVPVLVFIPVLVSSDVLADIPVGASDAKRAVLSLGTIEVMKSWITSRLDL